MRTINHKVVGLAILTTMTSTICLARGNNNTVKGRIAELSNGSALPYATITIESGNKIVGGTTSGDDGTFYIANIQDGSCKMKVSFIGFRDTTINLNIAQKGGEYNTGTIYLASDNRSLKAAVVTAKIPVIEQKLDKIVMNVADAVSTQGASALEVLRKAPGISIDPSGNILLNGQQVQVWIDNRPSNLTGSDLEALLSGTDGASIDKIEIISQPSAKYDAQGSGGIINIKTKKLFLEGLNGSLRAAYDGAQYHKYYQGANGTLNLNYRSGKNNTFVNYSPRYNESFSEFFSETIYGNSVLKANTRGNEATTSHNFKIGNDYYASKNSIFGFIVNGSFRTNEDLSDDKTYSELYVNNNLIQKINTVLDNNRSMHNISANLNHTYTFKQGEEVTTNIDYGYFDLSNDSYQNNRIFNGSGTEFDPKRFESTSSQFINIVSAKVDYERIIAGKIKMETGVKWALSSTNNDLIRNDWVTNSWQFNDTLSSKFKYDEHVTAAYISFAQQFNKNWTAKAGLRAEHTYSKGEWISADTVTTNSYIDLFPTLFVGYNPNQNLRFALSYTLRIQRPNYQQLNPFRIYIDANSSLEGNPDLDPQFNHQFSLTAGYKSFISLSAVYQSSNKTIIQNPYFSNVTGEKKLIWQNFGRQSFAGGSLSLTEIALQKWMVLNVNLFLAKVTNKSTNFKSSDIFSNGFFNLAFLMPKSFRAEVQGFYQSSIPYGYFKVDPVTEISLAFKKGIWDNKGTISLNINDIFRLRKNNVAANTDQIEGYFFKNSYKTQFVSVSFNYRFGKGKAARKRNVGVQEEASRVGNQN